VHELRRRHINTVAHVRPDSKLLLVWQAEFGRAGAATDTAPWSEATMAAALQRHTPTVIYALLGTTRAQGGDYLGIDYGLTATLLRAARAAAPDARFVYLSSVGVGPRARGEYLQLRWRFEQELRESGQPWTIARPSFITGPDREQDRPRERAAAAVADAVLAVAARLGASGLRDRYRSMNATILARALVHAGFDADTAARVLDAAALRHLSLAGTGPAE